MRENAMERVQPVRRYAGNPAFVRSEKHASKMYWGASLAAFRHLLEGRGYVFVGTNSVGTNAFFVLKKHEAAISGTVANAVSFPCKMREASHMDGTLAHKTYQECRDWVADLEVIDVTTGQSRKIGTLAGAGAA